MRIDVHAHYWTEDYLDLLVDLGKTDAGMARGIGAGGGAELEARLRLMDRAGVEMQVLSACPQVPYVEDGQKAARAARFVNDQYADLVQRRPDRFRAFAALPMPHLEESIGEMGRALDELRMAGVAMNTTVLGRALVEPEYEPIFAELNSRSAVLYLHPAGNSACSPLIGNYHLTWMVGAPVEDTISIMHLITHGIPARYPHIKIINSHLGGALPMLLQRADDQYRLGGTGHPGAARAWPRAGCGTTRSGTGTSRPSGARSTHSARTGSSSEPTSPTKTGTYSSARWTTSTTPRSTRAPPGTSSTRTPAPCSASDNAKRWNRNIPATSMGVVGTENPNVGRPPVNVPRSN